MITTIINNTKWFIKFNSNRYQSEVQIGYIFNLSEDNNVKFNKEFILGIGKSKWNLNDKYDPLYGISLSTYRAVNQVNIALFGLNDNLANNITIELIRFLANKLPKIINKIDKEIINDIEKYKIKEY